MKNLNGLFDRQQSEFVAYMARLKECHDHAIRKLGEIDDYKCKIRERELNIEAAYQRQVKMEANAKKNLEKSDETLSKAEAYEKEKNKLLKQLEKKQRELDEGFEKLDKQRSDLSESQKQILKRTKMVHMLERKVKADRLQLDQLIMDNKLS